MNSKKVGKVLGTALALFLLAMVMQPVTAGVSAEITAVELNGHSGFIEVAPGEIIGVEVFFKWMNVWSPQEALDEIVVGFEHTPIFCVVDTIINNVPDYDRGNSNAIKAFEITAPTEPGTYCIYMTTATEGTCEEAVALYKNAFGLQMIADFDVVDSEPDEPDKDDKWTLLHQSNITLSSPFGDRLYTIAFLQRQNDLRVQIQTPGVQEVETGKVFISVDEDVFVKYHTGCVYESIVGVEDSDFIELKPGASSSCETPKAFFNLVMGFVPYSGMFASSINLGTAIYNDTSAEFEVNEDLDLDRILDALPYEYFTTNKFQNERDVVTIPWALDIFNGREAIRVDCPRMEFPSKGIHTVVFCVVVNVHNVKVRHTIALPIEIGKQKREW